MPSQSQLEMEAQGRRHIGAASCQTLDPIIQHRRRPELSPVCEQCESPSMWPTVFIGGSTSPSSSMQWHQATQHQPTQPKIRHGSVWWYYVLLSHFSPRLAQARSLVWPSTTPEKLLNMGVVMPCLTPCIPQASQKRPSWCCRAGAVTNPRRRRAGRQLIDHTAGAGIRENSTGCMLPGHRMQAAEKHQA